MRFFKVEEIDEDTFTKQAGSYENIFVSGSQRGKDGAVYAFVDETEDISTHTLRGERDSTYCICEVTPPQQSGHFTKNHFKKRYFFT